jgi:hypothetical protein
MYIQPMSLLLDYPKISAARDAIGAIYTTAHSQLVVSITRENDAPVAVILKDDLKEALQALCPIEPKISFSKNGDVSIWIEGLPISAEGGSFEKASFALIAAMRDYAATWVDELRLYKNHKDRWAFANLILLSEDEELHAFLFSDD